MALTKSISKTVLGQELIFPNAYIKISTLFGNKTELLISVETYTEKGGELLNNIQYSMGVNLEGTNFIAQGYAYLKTLPEFADAVDC
jgi:hypothetical protein